MGQILGESHWRVTFRRLAVKKWARAAPYSSGKTPGAMGFLGVAGTVIVETRYYLSLCAHRLEVKFLSVMHLNFEVCRDANQPHYNL